MARSSDPERAREVATSIVTRLKGAGHVAYFAGGCVRDELLGLHPTDYDVATDATPQRVRELFPRSNEVGVKFGVMLVPEGAPDARPRSEGSRVQVEVATFRSDGPYSDARRPDVVHFSDPPTDAARRDFTINALFLDPTGTETRLPPAGGDGGATTHIAPSVRGTVIDYVNGLADLRNGVVRAVGDPTKRLGEDHLRALRGVRFAARLGFQMDPATAQAIRRHAADLKGVTRERIGEELRRMMAHPSRGRACGMLQDLGLDAHVLDEPHVDAALVALSGLEGPGQDPAPPYATCLGAWAVDRGVTPATAPHLGAPAAESGRRARRPGDLWAPFVTRWRRALSLSNDETDGLKGCLTKFGLVMEQWDAASVAGQKRMASGKWFKEALRIIRARCPERAAAIESRYAALDKMGTGVRPDPLITGDDLVALGMQPGPLFRSVLDRVYDAQLEGRIRSREEALELARILGVQP